MSIRQSGTESRRKTFPRQQHLFKLSENTDTHTGTHAHSDTL